MTQNKNRSLFDPSRETVGKIYRDAQIASHDQYVINGDLTHELTKSLVDDINDTIIEGTKEFNANPFFITVYEKKDLQMPRAILRRLYKTRYRPYPEDDTVVFSVNPKANDVRFCWCLPHHQEMDNMLINSHLFDKDMVGSIKAWKLNDLFHFGFTKDSSGNWMPNPHYKDKPLEKPRRVLVS